MNEPDLFEKSSDSKSKQELLLPLASRMRPESLEDFAGQEHILGPGKLLRRTIEADRLSSVIFFGPPGSGKTTLALIISRMTEARFTSVNAVTSNVAELRREVDAAAKHREFSGKRSILFIDEIHRFNKAQQDVLMPEVESGVVILIGATTHNPSFSIVGPLLSRSLVFELKPLEERDILRILDRALNHFDVPVLADPKALRFLATTSSGDARRALNALEVGILTTPPDARDGKIHFDLRAAEESTQRRIIYYDRDEDYHYDTISAFIKSMRGSDADGAVYWLAKMLYAGEDPRFIARRIVIFASEDIGNADPRALVIAASTLQAIEFVGMPEARIILSQAVLYLSKAPKNRSAYEAIEEATEKVKNEATEEVPEHLRNRKDFTLENQR